MSFVLMVLVVRKTILLLKTVKLNLIDYKETYLLDDFSFYGLVNDIKVTLKKNMYVSKKRECNMVS